MFVSYEISDFKGYCIKLDGPKWFPCSYYIDRKPYFNKSSAVFRFIIMVHLFFFDINVILCPQHIFWPCIDKN